MIKIIRRLVPANGAEAMVAFSRLVSLGIGPITVALIALKLSAVEQGYYFTFGAITGAMVLFELGIGYVLVQLVSHEAVKLTVNRSGVSGPPTAVSRVSSILRFGLAWHVFVTIAFLVTVGIGGFYYMGLENEPFATRQGPWILLMVATAAGLIINPIWATFEGCNLISTVYRIRLGKAVVVAFVFWLFLWLETGLWANGIADAVGTIFDFVLAGCFRRPIVALLQQLEGSRLHWRREIFPFQWRISVSWGSGYVTFALFTPIAFRLFGPEIAGKTGLTLALLNAIGGIAWSFMQANAPKLGMLVAQRDWRGYERLFLQKTMMTFVSFIGLCLAAAVSLATLDALGIPIMHRILDGMPLALFALGTLIVQISAVEGAYLRSYKREPLFWLSPATGILVLAGSLLFGEIYGPVGMAASYLAVYGLVSVPVGGIILFRCRREWQAAPVVEPCAGTVDFH